MDLKNKSYLWPKQLDVKVMMLHSQEHAVDVHANFFTNVCDKLIQQFNVHAMNVPFLASCLCASRHTLRTIMDTPGVVSHASFPAVLSAGSHDSKSLVYSCEHRLIVILHYGSLMVALLVSNMTRACEQVRMFAWSQQPVSSSSSFRCYC